MAWTRRILGLRGVLSGAGTLLAWQSLALPATLPSNFVYQQTLLDQPRLEQVSEISGQIWVAAGGELIWVVDPLAGTISTLSAAKGTVSEKVDRRVTADGTITKRTQRVEPESPDRRVQRKLPFAVGDEELHGQLLLTSVCDDTAWLIDKGNRRAWRMVEGLWQVPLKIGETIAAAAADSRGRLVLNTPAHGVHSFAVLGPDGHVEHRFGERLYPRLSALDNQTNTWVLAALGNGDLLAAHGYQPLLRRYSPEGALRWERAPDAPVVKQLEAAQRAAEVDLKLNPETSCVTCRQVSFATFVQDDGKNGIWIRFGQSAALEHFSADGDWIETVSIEHPPGAPWITAGIAVQGDVLIAFEPGGLNQYVASALDTVAVGLVVGEDWEPITGASVRARTSAGSEISVRTDRTGSFSLRGLGADETGTLTVSAPSYYGRTLSGVLENSLTDAIVLKPAAVQCIQVVDAESLAPVGQFELTLLHNPVTAQTASLVEGPRQEIEHPDGEACLEAPWSPPWLLRVEASGYAVHEVRLEAAERVRIELREEASVHVGIEGEDGVAVEGAAVYFEEASLPKRTGRIYPDHLHTVSGKEGIAQFSGLGAGDYRLKVSHEDFLVWEEEVSLAQGDNEVPVVLAAGSRVLVSVRDSVDSTPIAEAKVRLIGSASSQVTAKRLVCETAADGTCSVPAVPPGLFDVRASAKGYSKGRAPLVVKPGEARLRAEVKIGRGVRLTGTVVGVENYPDSEFVVWATIPGVPFLKAPIDDSGSFAINEIPPGKVDLEVLDTEQSAFLLERIEIPGQVQDFEAVLYLPDPIRLEGRITRGREVCGACTIAVNQHEADMAVRAYSTSADAEGRYSLSVPGAGAYRIDISDADTGLTLTDFLQFSTSTTADFDLGQLELMGVVSTSEGVPASAALVQVFSSGQKLAETVAGDLGRFRFDGLLPQSYQFSATHGEAAVSKHMELVSGVVNELDLVLPAEEALRLRLLDAQSNLPVLLTELLLIGSRGESFHHSRLFADEEGVISVPSPVNGPWTLVLDAPRYALKTVRGLAPGPEPATVYLHSNYRSFTVVVPKEVSREPCAFELLGQDGLPVALAVSVPPGPVSMTRREAAFNGFEPGRYTAVLHSCDGSRHSQPMTLATGSIPRLRFHGD